MKLYAKLYAKLNNKLIFFIISIIIISIIISIFIIIIIIVIYHLKFTTYLSFRQFFIFFQSKSRDGGLACLILNKPTNFFCLFIYFFLWYIFFISPHWANNS